MCIYCQYCCTYHIKHIQTICSYLHLSMLLSIGLFPEVSLADVHLWGRTGQGAYFFAPCSRCWKTYQKKKPQGGWINHQFKVADWPFLYSFWLAFFSPNSVSHWGVLTVRVKPLRSRCKFLSPSFFTAQGHKKRDSGGQNLRFACAKRVLGIFFCVSL